MAKRTVKQVAADRLKVPITVQVPLDLLDLLEDAARARSRRIKMQNAQLPRGKKIGNSRASVSAVVVAILEAHRDEIKKAGDV